MRLYTHPYLFQISSAHSAMSDSLIHHGLQHARILCHHQSRSLLKLMCIKTVMPSNQLIHHHPLHFLPQSFPASESFPMNQFFASGGQSIGVSASASVLPMNIHDWFPLDWLVWFPCSPRDSQESSLTPQFRSIRSSVLSFLYSPTLLELTTGKTNKQTNKQTKKTHDFGWQNFAAKVISLPFSMLSKLVITFLSRSKHLLISLLKSPSAVKLKSKKINVSLFWGFHFYLPWSDRTGCHDLSFSKVLSQLFHSLISISSRGSLIHLPFQTWMMSSAYLRLFIFLPVVLIPACDLPSPAFRMMYTSFKLNK